MTHVLYDQMRGDIVAWSSAIVSPNSRTLVLVPEKVDQEAEDTGPRNSIFESGLYMEVSAIDNQVWYNSRHSRIP